MLHLSFFLLTGATLSKALGTVQIVLESSKKTLVFYSYIIPAAEKFYWKEKEKLWNVHSNDSNEGTMAIPVGEFSRGGYKIRKFFD